MSAKQLDEHRYWNVDAHGDWWAYIQEDWKTNLAEKGIELETLYFSGFSSQGDGACFPGRIADNVLFLKAHTTEKEYPMLWQCDSGFTSQWCQQGMYYHENSLLFYFDYTGFEWAMAEQYHMPTLQEFKITKFEDEYKAEVNTLEEYVREVIRDYCREIYRDLEAEYDYLTSDEAVKESLIANDMWEEGD